MSTQELFKAADKLEQQINSSDTKGRLALQPELSRVLELLQAEGGQVPLRLRRLDASLCDEAIEARFDNFPI